MSHFLTLVILPGDTPEDSVEDTVASLLAPYDEHLHVPEYMMQCRCVGRKTTMEVEAVLNKQFDLTALRRKFQRLRRKNRTEVKWDQLLTPRLVEREKLLTAHPLKDKPDADCKECGGSGQHLTTYSPNSKWDIWWIGGRWDGTLYGPERQAQCRDTKDKGYNVGDAHHRLENNSRLVKDIPIDDPHYVPFAILTPEGEWIEQGKMGWWAIVSDAMGDKEWQETAKSVLAKYPDHLAVAVDCHI